MAPKFEDVTQEVVDLFEEVRGEYFPELAGALIKLVYTTKRIRRGGRITFAYIQKFNDFGRFLTSEEAEREDGYDYAIVIVKKIFEALNKADRIRLLRHELRHTVYDPEKTDPYKIRDHTIQDFYEDVEIESQPGGDPRWGERCAEIAMSIYEREDEEKKQSKGGKRGRRKKG